MSSSNSNKDIEKASNIIAALEQCGCTHCLLILKSGLGNPTVPNHAAIDDPTTITPEPTRNESQEIIRESS